MNDEIIKFIREQPDGAGAAPVTIAERFLRFKSPNKALADTAVRAILSKDARVYCGDDGLWRANLSASLTLGRTGEGAGVDVVNIPWVSIYLMIDPVHKSIIHTSVWTPLPEPACLHSIWLKDPAQFSEDDRQQFTDPRDAPFSEQAAVSAIEQIARDLADKVPIFFSQQQYSILAQSIQNHGGAGVDDYYLMNQLLRVIKEPECRPLTLDNAASTLIGGFRAAESAYRQGELFCRIAAEIVGRMKPAGIESRGILDGVLYDCTDFDFTGKDISAKMIAELPLLAGVYGFTDKSGAYIYIGKAVNLRRRIENYFRFNSESPEKLGKLRKEAHGLTIHRCGSELEALIYEYRLIKKHKPALNIHKAISERKGAYKPIADSVILLPHVQDGFCTSVWIRKDQKVRIRPFELTFDEEEALVRELQEYFYSGTLPASPDDFPELEIVTRWIKRHRDGVSVISVGNMADAQEILNTMKNM